MLKREVARPSTRKLGNWVLLLLIPIFLGDLRALTRLACRVMIIPSSRVLQLVSNVHVSRHGLESTVVPSPT